MLTFTEKLKRLMEEQNKAQIARRAGLSPTAIHDYLTRGYMPAADSALRLARALGVGVEWLVDSEQDWPPLRVATVKVVERYADTRPQLVA